MTRFPPYFCVAAQTGNKIHTAGFRTAGMLPSTYFAGVLVNGSKLHPSHLLQFRNTGRGMSATLDLKENCQTMASSCYKSNDQSSDRLVITIQAQHRNSENLRAVGGPVFWKGILKNWSWDVYESLEFFVSVSISRCDLYKQWTS